LKELRVGDVVVDGDHLKQAIANLLENAIKFMLEGRQVSIGLECFELGRQITVSDIGIGIRPDFCPMCSISLRRSKSPVAIHREKWGLD
jgi:signal transduction histidine kinase